MKTSMWVALLAFSLSETPIWSNSLSVNQAIPDGDPAGLASTIHVSGEAGGIGSLQVDLNISGTFNGDLYAYLSHDGAIAILLNRPGTTASDSLGYGDHGLNVTFTDGAANEDIHNYRSSLFGSASTPLSGPLTGAWSPDGRQSSPFNVTEADSRSALLSSFDGLDPNGDWTLFVADLSGGDLHQLNSWGLDLNAVANAVPERDDTALLLMMGLGIIGLVGGFARFWRVGGLQVGGGVGVSSLGSARLRQGWPTRKSAAAVLKTCCLEAGNRAEAGSRRRLVIGLISVMACAGTAWAATGASMTGWGWLTVWPVNGYGATFTKIASGSQHSLAIKNDGTVVAWGVNSGVCDVPLDLSNVVAVAGGFYYSLALKRDGTVVGWGANEDGQCNVPGGLSGVVAIAAGESRSLALKDDGTVVGWGSPIAGDDIENELSGVTSIAAASEHCLALKSDGTVVAWGQNEDGQSDVPAGLSNVTAIAAGGRHSMALKADGSVVAWGRNVEGECNVPSGLIDVIAVTGGGFHSLALKRDGTVVAWGANLDGAGEVPAGLGGIKAIAAGYAHSLALTADGKIVAWGSNDFGESMAPGSGTDVTAISALYFGVNLALKTDGTVFQWGQDSEFLDVPTGLSGVVAISAGGLHNLALKKDGTVVGWGLQSEVPPGLSGVVAIDARGGDSLALKADGTVVAWTGSEAEDSNVPQTLSEVVAIAGGGGHYLALKEDGSVVAWGRNVEGQCNVPSGLSGVVAIAASAGHSLALRGDGTVVAWGLNSSGQCDVPAGLTGVVSIAAGDPQSMAVKSDGTVVAWGDNFFGQRNVPSKLSGVVSIATSGSLNLALFDGIDQPPVTGTYKLATSRNTARSMPLFKLHQVCSDPDWDSFIITAVSPNTAAGGTAQINGSTVLYTPPLDFVGSDSFTYTVRDCRGAISQGIVNVTVSAATGNGQNIVKVTVSSSGVATLDFAGIPGVPYVIDVSTDLVHWNSIGSVTAGPNGLFEFVDPQAGNYTSRYYRTRHTL